MQQQQQWKQHERKRQQRLPVDLCDPLQLLFLLAFNEEPTISRKEKREWRVESGEPRPTSTSTSTSSSSSLAHGLIQKSRPFPLTCQCCWAASACCNLQNISPVIQFARPPKTAAPRIPIPIPVLQVPLHNGVFNNYAAVLFLVFPAAVVLAALLPHWPIVLSFQGERYHPLPIRQSANILVYWRFLPFLSPPPSYPKSGNLNIIESIPREPPPICHPRTVKITPPNDAKPQA